ncbi:MAG: enoyl-CoA hydratase/isomerase family protein [Acidimicrobiales bacterium]
MDDGSTLGSRSSSLELSDEGTVTIVRLLHGKVNAMDVELMRELRRTFDELPPGGAVVVTGNGRAFSAGVDLRRVVEGGPEYVAEFLPVFSDALLAVLTHPGPVVAAVDGHAIAGGAILALACDYRIMAAGRFGVPELAVGVPFPTVPLEILRLAGTAAFRPAVLRRSTLLVEEAVAKGLIDDAAEPERLMDAALAQSKALAAIPAESFALTKEAMHAPTLERIVRDRPLRDPAVIAAWSSPEVLAGIAAYLDGLSSRS